MTVSEVAGGMALPDGSHVGGPTRVGVNARARVKRSLAQRDQTRKARLAQIAAVAGRISRVMWLDAADSWIVRDSTPSLRRVWATDYTAHLQDPYGPYVWWCKGYRLFAVATVAPLHAVLWLLAHPVRGPLFLTATGVGIAAATHL